MTTRTKHWLFFSLTALFAVGVTIVMYAVLWSDMSESERELGVQLLPRAIAYGSLALVIMFLVSSQFVSYVFKHYITPVEKLSEETHLISVANANYRITTEGAEEIQQLTSIINELGEKHVTLKTDVQKIVQKSRMELTEEKKRLETLMSQIPGGVLVCNLDGRVLLYNHIAQDVLQSIQANPNGQTAGPVMLGLGRSIFGFLDRAPILHSLNYLQNRIYEGDSDPSFNFITTRKGEQFIKVNIAPVKGAEGRDISGYILTIDDITNKIKEESKRDIFLQSLTIGLQMELGKIHHAAQQLMVNGESGGKQMPYINAINASAGVLLEQIDMVAVQHANRLNKRENDDFLLAEDLLNVLKENIWEKFSIEANVQVEESLWLNINSYTIIRGVMYLMGQLRLYMNLDKVDLTLKHNDKSAQLKIHWEGGAINVDKLEEWKKCPLMPGAKGAGPINLENLMIGRGEVSGTGNTGAASDYVYFNLDVEKPETVWKVHTHKVHRPVYYEFDLFEQPGTSSDLVDIPLDKLTYLVFDTETTGLNPSGGDEIISLAGIRIIKGHIHYEETFDEMVDPRRNIPLESLKIHEIYPDMLVGKPLIEEVLPRFHKYAEGAVLVAHNAAFDMEFLQLKEKACNLEFNNPVLDTLHLSAIVNPLQETHNLEDIAERFGLDIIGRHTALGDSIVTGEILLKIIPMLKDMGIITLGDALSASSKSRYARIRF